MSEPQNNTAQALDQDARDHLSRNIALADAVSLVYREVAYRRDEAARVADSVRAENLTLLLDEMRDEFPLECPDVQHQTTPTRATAYVSLAPCHRTSEG